MKTNKRLSTKFYIAYNALLAVITVSFILCLVSFVIPMPSVLVHMIHAVMFAGFCLAVPSVIIILYRYHFFAKSRMFLS